MNFVFISPHFPENYWRFCAALKKDGVCVCGIADVPYENLKPELKNALSDYYRVDDLSNYDQKVKAVGYFISRHGKIDFIESNNEFWMSDDAQLREDFNVTTGPKTAQVQYFRRKSLMKEKYKEARVKCAPFHLVKDENDCAPFIRKVGYPLCAKPDDGVGASSTFRIDNEKDLENFFAKKEKGRTYILEPFISGTLISFDGVCDSKGNVVYPTHHVFPSQPMSILAGNTDCCYYTSKKVPKYLYDAGQRILKAFGAKSRFYHLEFFRLDKDQVCGKKGDLVGLEVNMRVPGGYTPDMIDFAYSLDIYQVWGDVMAFDKTNVKLDLTKYYCAYVGRRKNVSYVHDVSEINAAYAGKICFEKDNPPALADDLGDYFFMCKCASLKEVRGFFRYVSARK
jgi:hypothetical protein